ncbi:hypothetical protein L13192_06075 [Pyrenophora tritici-repentis]|uniref:Uncharacterized protein n=1 Tax=Pyrenophora tritici-repentis TaxID=45151 RepID=A0A922T0X6_9PLEO|nr:hypothetical protein Ptr86124_003817 [Pyrenophora tritici-repentis]KAI1670559.1 hypothetical protein L13192_06075 [Pyrenophora tritici-repentis]KAI1682183.1 hypothetical protein KJE20_09054 [Pyrenophora tritici-repentis]
MHPAALLISLAGFAAAVPLPHDMTDGQAMNMAHDAVQPKVETYAEYGAYYTDYGNYAKTDQGVAKRTKMATYTPHSNYGCYPGASVEDVTNMKKRGYSRYDSHGTYPEAVDDEGGKMDTDKMMARRHMKMTHEEMMKMMKDNGDADDTMMTKGDSDNDDNDDGTMMQKRDMPSTSDTGERKAPHESLPDNDDKYHIYDPYTEYGHYSAAGGGEGVEKMQ